MMGLGESLLGVGILVGFGLLIYMRMSGRTFRDVIQDIRGGFS